MARPAALAYRCRHCNAIFHPAHVPDGSVAISLALIGEHTNPPPGWGKPVPAVEVHRCAANMAGFADFAGVVFDAIDAIDGPG